MKIAANLSLLFTELPLIERILAARVAGFDGVEIQFPYEVPAIRLKDQLERAGLPLVLATGPGTELRRPLGITIIGGLFVLEAVSVIVQVTSFKLTGKRVFRMAPLHHHFEQKGWTEPQIVIRFWIISVMLALAGLSTLKLR